MKTKEMGAWKQGKTGITPTNGTNVAAIHIEGV